MQVLRRNPWMWWILVPLGFTAWLSPLIAGVRTQRKMWTTAGVVWLCLWLTGFALTAGPDEDSTLSDIGVTLWFGSWLAPLVHTVIIRPQYERLMAVLADPRLGQRSVAIEQQQYARELVRKDPLRARGAWGLAVRTSRERSTPASST